jgi:hypothetical protein
VTVNVTQTVAPTPNTLQKTGALISVGATTLTAGTKSLLTQLADLTALLKGTVTNTSIAWASGTATWTSSAPHGITVGQQELVTIAGATPVGYNGTYNVTATTANAGTYTIVNPGSPTATAPGSWTLEDVAELNQMATTFFAQGSSVPVYVLELGESDSPTAVAALATWLNNNPQSIYSFLVPREWDGIASFLALIAQYEGLTAQTYFFVTTTIATYMAYTALMKCVFAMVEAPAVVTAGPAGLEFSLAAVMWNTLHYNPSSTNLVTPTAFTFLYGVTPYPTPGNATLFASLQTAAVNWVGTGAEGGISTAILLWGTTMDKNDFTYWYSVDWSQINSDLFVSNAVINGSNNPLAPLLYNQYGINTLQATEISVMKQAIGNGLALGKLTAVTLSAQQFIENLQDGDYAGQVVVNAEPFSIYSKENPSDYGIGKYGGLSVAFTPARGFKQIIINVHVSNFAAV